MKNGIIAIMLIFSASSIFSMEEVKKGSLCFSLDSERRIIGWSAHNGMSFYEEPEKFDRKDIVEVLPLDEEKKKKIIEKFNAAAKKNRIKEVIYSIKVMDEGFLYAAEIIPLSSNSGISFFVKVTEVGEFFAR